MGIQFNRAIKENEKNQDLIDGYYREISIHPQNIDAHLLLGDALHALERYEEAITVYEQALDAHPDCGAVYYNKGNALLEMQRWEEAILSYRQAIRLIPAFAEGYVTIATALQALRRPYEAMASCYRALAIDSRCAEAHWNLGLALLQVGEFTRGWEEFEWRWKKRGYTSKLRYFHQPMWDGSPLSGQTILIHAEQAFGDTIQFVRFLPWVARQCGKVILECPTTLKGLMTGLKEVNKVVAAGEELPLFDVHLPLMSLPGIFNADLETIPRDFPYIFPQGDFLADWSERVKEDGTFRIGIVWAGRKRPDPNRTCPLVNFAPISQVPGISLYSLQIGAETERDEATAEILGLVDLSSEIRDFCDTAALIAQLDLVVSIDTAVAHLAGAMGKETWVLLPYAADWRWMVDRDDSPWYPTMRLFRQERPGDWRGVIKRVRFALVDKLAAFQN